MAHDPRDPDASLVALFKHHAVLNENKTVAEGRPIYDDVEIVEIRFPGSRAMSPFPATAISHWAQDPYTGTQRQVTYAERFKRQYQQFKEQNAQTKSGTPLDFVPFLTEGKRAELRAQNIYTVEALADIDGNELKNLGVGGREWKNQAQEFIAESKTSAPNLQLQAELDAIKARNAILEEDMAAAKQAIAEGRVRASKEDDFDDMTTDALREYITTHTGHTPVGTGLNRKALVKLAMEARPAKAA